jgi:four helix bundle protein
MHDFRRLHVWQRARRFVVTIDELTRRFPRQDRGVVASQLRRSAAGISATIAEGCGKSSRKETARFLDIATASAAETENHLVTATDLGYVHAKRSAALQEELSSIRRMLYRLRLSFVDPQPPD